MKKLLQYTGNVLILILILLSIDPIPAYGQQPDQAFNPSVEQSADLNEVQTDDEIDIEVSNLGQPTQSEQLEQLDPPHNLTAEGAVVIEQNSGKVLYGKQEHQKLFPASTTKILTALIAVEYGHLDEVVTVGEEVQAHMLAWDGSKAGLEEREEISLRNLVYGLMINSGNDAANTIAVHIARKVSEEDLPTVEALEYFGNLMNKRAREAGAKNSHFVNPHGYHDDDHYTTAYDLAMIGKEAMKNAFFREATSTISMVNTYWTSGEPRFWGSKNKLLQKNDPEHYEYAVGGKTGYTSMSGSCLVSFAAKDNQNLVAVVLKSNTGNQWSDTRALFEYGFSNFEYVVALKQGTIIETLPVDNYASEDWGSLAIEVSSENWGDVFRKQDIGQIDQEITWDSSIFSKKATNEMPRLEAPIYKGQQIGELRLKLKGEVLTRVPLTAVRDVRRKKFMDILTPEPGASSSGFSWPRLTVYIITAFVILRIVVFFINRRRRQRYTMYRRYE